MKSCLFAIKRTRFLMKLMLLTVILVSIPAIQADIITFQYEGEITSVDTGLEGVFSIGDSFEGTYTFESDTDALGGGIPFFYYDKAISATSFRSDTFTASGNSGAFVFDKDHGFYTAYLDFGSVAPEGDFTPLSLSLGWFLLKGSVPNVETRFSKTGMILEQPSFDPNMTPIYVTESMATFLDADGNVVYDGYDGSGKGLIEDPHQPLFFTSGGGGGSPAAGPGGGMLIF